MAGHPTYEKVLLVLRQIVRAIDVRSRRLVHEYGLTGPQLVVLRALALHDAVSPGDLAESVNLSHGTVTGILDRLEKRGLIRRTRSDADRRRVKVSLDPAGQSVISNAPPMMHEQFIEQFVKLADWEQTLILSSMQRLASMMSVSGLAKESVLETVPVGLETREAIEVLCARPVELPTGDAPDGKGGQM